MSILVDTFVKTEPQCLAEVEPGKWAISKPLNGPFVWRIKDAWRVLCGRSVAVHYAEDVIAERKPQEP